MTTVHENVAGGPQHSREHRALAWGGATALAMVLAVVVASTVQIPYYAIAPGSAVAVAPLVRVIEGPSYPPKGSVLLTTVSLGQTTVLEALEGWLNPAIDVVDQDVVVPPDTNRDEFREQNLQAMDISKQTALGVAFEHLGFDAITGKGATIIEVLAGHPADGKLAPGDVVTAVDGAPAEVSPVAVELIGRRSPGDTVRLTVRSSDGRTRDVDIQLGRRPDGGDRGFLGVTMQTAEPAFDFPYEVEIASDRIGGPSAGLAFTLEILDVLTPGELTGGLTVATTGTIELDGTVGIVGGVAQKTAAVRDAGADLFLVPIGELAQARRHAGDLRVEGVATLDDALRILASLGGNGLALGRPGAERG